VVPGLDSSIITIVHVVLGLGGLAAGAVVLLGMLCSRALPGTTAFFLAATLLGDATGLLFPFAGLGFSYVAGALSFVVLVPTLTAFYLYRLAGAWRGIYAAGVTTLLCLEAVIAFGHCIANITFLRSLSQTSVEFAMEALIIATLVILGTLAVRYFHPPSAV
jgi:hypothetical protein